MGISLVGEHQGRGTGPAADVCDPEATPTLQYRNFKRQTRLRSPPGPWRA